MKSKIWLPFLLLFTLSWGQDKNYNTFGWRPMKIPSSIIPYRVDTTTTTYDSRYFETGPAAAAYQGSTAFYQDSSKPFPDNSGSYQADSYSSDFRKSQPYQYPDDSGSYEQYGYTKDDNFNVTVERYGGFGGTGDTRGYGAYDYPKKVQDVPQHIHEENPLINTDFPDLLRVSRSRNIYRRRGPALVHPLPPPI